EPFAATALPAQHFPADRDPWSGGRAAGQHQPGGRQWPGAADDARHQWRIADTGVAGGAYPERQPFAQPTADQCRQSGRLPVYRLPGRTRDPGNMLGAGRWQLAAEDRRAAQRILQRFPGGHFQPQGDYLFRVVLSPVHPGHTFLQPQCGIARRALGGDRFLGHDLLHPARPAILRDPAPGEDQLRVQRPAAADGDLRCSVRGQGDVREPVL
ncbi:Efflux protein, LysE family, partial [Pseudomonas sp. FEN]